LWRRRCVHPSIFDEEKLCSPQYFCGGEDVFTPVICGEDVFTPVICGGEDVFTPVFLWRRRCVHPSIFVEEKMCSPQYFW
jgi:hypothetical protein